VITDPPPDRDGNAIPAASGLVCRGCGDPRTRLVVDLGRQPASDDFPQLSAPGPDARWPLQLWFCPTCALAQLGPVEALLEEPVRAVESETHRQHSARAAAVVLADHAQLVGHPVREFASHHGGSWLATLAEYGCESAAPGEPAALVVDVHGLAHEEDVQGCLAERAAGLAPDGLLVLEFHHLLPLVEEGQFDTVRHGHWSYLSLTAVDRLAARHGLIVIKAVAEPIFGGSLRVVLAHASSTHLVGLSVPRLLEAERAAGLDDGRGLESLGARALESARELKSFLLAQRSAGRRVLAYGAPSKAAVLLGLSDVDAGLLEFTVDAAPLKHGLAIPGARVPIRPVQDLIDARPDVVLILTWDIADEVVATLERDGGWGAEYVVPLPRPRALVAAGTVH
jgi:hypothetical protein